MNPLQRFRRRAHFKEGSWLRHALGTVLLAMGLIATVTCIPIPSTWAQIPFRVGVNEDVAGEAVFLPPPPRELRRALKEAERAVQERQYSEAVEALNQILDQPDSEDYFLPSDGGQEVVSLKQRALQLLGAMPKAGREIYELEAGSEARRLLEYAVSQGDFDGITEVSRRFFHTTVGYQATMLLARLELDEGRPLAAALHLERLHKTDGARKLFGEELILQLAVCWKLSGFEDVAVRVLQEERDGQSLAGATLMVGGKPESLPQKAEELGDWLDGIIGRGVTLQRAGHNDWALFRGGPDRNATTTGGMPLNKLEWALESCLVPAEEALVLQTHESLISNEIPAIPVMQPLAVNNQLLMRTARVMLGVDMETGLRIWPYPEEYLDTTGDTEPADRSAVRRQRPDKAAQLRQRFWQDAIYAQMSSDGERLFLLRDLEPSQDASPRQLAINRLQGRVMAEPEHNRLVALELGTQGKTLWTIGGKDSSDSRLESIYFLGVPLPLAGHLYAIAEIKDELKLVVLNVETGELEWTQQLAQVESPLGYTLNEVRRLAGATPSFAEGILVCPTSSGAVIAVDIASRSLRWGHKYSLSTSPRQSQTRRIGFNTYAMNAIPSPGGHWADSVAIIKDGSVILTPFESDRLMCLDLLTGEEKWKSKTRNQGLYVGTVAGGVILLLERHKIVGLDLHTGKPSWPPIELENDEYPTGRGFLNGHAYYFPTSRSELLKVDVHAGHIVERQATDRVLGNLVCHGDFLISQNADGVFAYPLRERRREYVAEQIKLTPNDPNLLEDHASLLVGDGKRDDAMDALRRSIKFQTDDERKITSSNMLVRIMIDAMRDDFPANRGLVDEAMRLSSDTETRLNLARVVASGLTKNGAKDAGFAAYLDLIDATIEYRTVNPVSNHRQLRRGDSNWRKGEPIELAERVQELMEGVDPSQRGGMRESLLARLSEVSTVAKIPRLRGWLRVITQMAFRTTEADDGLSRSFQDSVDMMRLGLARKLIAEAQPLEAVMLLAQIKDGSDASNESLVAEAQALRARCLANHGQRRLAELSFASLAEKHGNEPILEGRSALQLQQDFLKQIDEQMQAASGKVPPFGATSVHRWPTGKIKVSPATFSAPPTIPQWYPVQLLSATDDWPAGFRIVFDNQNQEILILDGYNRVTKRVGIKSTNRSAYRATKARVFGHLLVVSFGTNIVGIDLLTQKPDAELVWDVNLADADGMIAIDPFGRPKRVNTQTHSVLFSTPQNYFVGPDGKQVGQIGPVTYNGVCIIRQGDLHCLDPVTGELKWVRRNVGNYTLLGDDQYVAVVRQSGEMRIFEIHDGAELKPEEEGETLRGPLASMHWTTYGRNILYWDGSYSRGTGLELRLYDTVEQRDQWVWPIAAKSKGWIVDGDELALLQPDGRFVILGMADGKPILETKLLPEIHLAPFIYVMKSSHQYLVITNRDDSRRISKLTRGQVQVQLILPQIGWQPQTPRITGHMYALDRATGEPIWEKPVSVEQFGVLLPQAAEIPVVTFFRQVRIRRKKPNNEKAYETITKTSVAVVDRRTGKEVFQRNDLPIRLSSFCSVSADLDANRLKLFLPTETEFEMQLTEEPDDAPIAELLPFSLDIKDK